MTGPGCTGRGPVLGRRGVLAGLAAAALAGCADVPSSGPVEQVSASPGAPVASGVQVRPSGPPRDATPDVVMAGFLDAMSALENDHATAREYLTPAAARSWDPDKGVTVFETASRKDITTSTSAALRSRLVGRLDEQGHFTGTDQLTTLDMGMQKVQGQWRISKPPAGILVSQSTLQHDFTPVTVWFLTEDLRTVVPEVVWMAGTAGPSEAVQALLRGPSAWLAPAVQHVLPADAVLESPVQVSQGVAHVSLDKTAAALDDSHRRALFAQLGWTLSAFDEVDAVAVVAGDQPLDVTGGAGNAQVQLDDLAGFSAVASDTSGVAAQPVVVGSAGLGQVAADGSFTPLASLPASLARTRTASWIAVSQATSALALVDRAGTVLTTFTPGGTPRTTHLPSRATGLQVSAQGDFWLALSGAASSCLHRLDGAVLRQVAAPELGSGQLVSFSLAPDGARIAVVLERAGRRRLGLLRLRQGRFEGWREVEVSLGSRQVSGLADVAWGTPSTLAVLLAASGSSRPEVVLVDADGARTTELGPSGNGQVRSLVTQPRHDGTTAALLDDAGQLLHYEAAWRWPVVAGGITAACYPA